MYESCLSQSSITAHIHCGSYDDPKNSSLNIWRISPLHKSNGTLIDRIGYNWILLIIWEGCFFPYRTYLHLLNRLTRVRSVNPLEALNVIGSWGIFQRNFSFKYLKKSALFASVWAFAASLIYFPFRNSTIFQALWQIREKYPFKMFHLVTNQNPQSKIFILHFSRVYSAIFSHDLAIIPFL